jgi:hypothetical protein
MLAELRVIAKGRRIRDLQRLLVEYGGLASKWMKKSSPPIEFEGEFFEYHWYEHPGLGRFEVKRKMVMES